MGHHVSQLLCSSESDSDGLYRTPSRQFMVVEEVIVPPTLHGESPHWCNISKSLFYIDIAAKTVYSYSPSTKIVDSMIMNSVVGFAVPTSRTTAHKVVLFVGLESEIVEVDFTNKDILRVVSSLPENVSKNSRFNDGKCNHDGRLYAGYMNRKWRDGEKGNLYQLCRSNLKSAEAPMDLHPMFDHNECHLPNGSTWMKNGDLFFIDSGNNTINCYAESKTADGSHEIRKTRIIYTLGDEDKSFGGMLDGMTSDSDGKLWVAVVGASCLIRIDPENGKELMRLRLPITNPTACTFGGPDLNDMYITSRDDCDGIPKGKLFVARLHKIKGLSAGIPVAVPSESSFPDLYSLFF